MMKSFKAGILWLLLPALIFTSCSEQKEKRVINFPKTDLAAESLIPKPLEIVSGGSGFALDQFTVISAPDFEPAGKFLAEKIKEQTGLDLPVNAAENPKTETIILITKTTGEGPAEAYELSVSQDSIVLSANTEAGAFRGLQTLRQLIPVQADESLLAESKIWVIPTGKINDKPQFEYRGAMLDVARHFFSVDEVKKFIDALAYYKFNVLHLHLTDDQGWRIEIKSWPKLTEIGGKTEVGGKSGGFYTQADYTELVNYAAAHHIMIVPEVDMPGHTNAASASYPILNGNGKTPELYEGTEVGFSTFDSRKDTVYAFIDDVVREISALSPGPYFHIGGDESHVTKKEDYLYFINRTEKIVQKHGKIMVGWDEAVNAEVSSSSVAQFWASKKNADLAVEKGLKLIMSPAKKAYLDMKYDSLSQFGLQWAGLIPVDTAYIWSPEDYEGIPATSVLGIEAPLWTETVSNSEEMEYLVFPRVIGYAELGWSTKENRNWENYKGRLVGQVPYLERMNIKYYASPKVEWKK